MYQEFSCIQIKVHVARTHVNENFGSVFFSFKTFNQPEKVQLFYTLVSWTTHENSEKIGFCWKLNYILFDFQGQWESPT